MDANCKSYHTGLIINLNKLYRYVGTEEGIFEYTVNVEDRMQFPSYELR